MPLLLVVDDDPTVRSSITRLLASASYDVIEAENGSEALSKLGEQQPDLVLMDIIMPEQGGLQTIMEMHATHASVPIVIMSGKVPLETEAMNSVMEKYGAHGVLAKPFTADELLATVARVLSESP